MPYFHDGSVATLPAAVDQMLGGGLPKEIQALARHYAAARDGQRFLISGATDEAQSAPLTVVLNWTAALKE